MKSWDYMCLSLLLAPFLFWKITKAQSSVRNAVGPTHSIPASAVLTWSRSKALPITPSEVLIACHSQAHLKKPLSCVALFQGDDGASFLYSSMCCWETENSTLILKPFIVCQRSCGPDLQHRWKWPLPHWEIGHRPPISPCLQFGHSDCSCGLGSEVSEALSTIWLQYEQQDNVNK